MSDNNGLPGKPGVREELEYALAMHFSNNRMPHMSGDPRNRLSSLQRRNMEDAVTSILEVIGPCLTPAEVEARVKEARRDALADAVKMAKRAGEHHQETALRMGITPTIGGATETICLAIDALSDTPLDDPKRIELTRKVFGITAPAGKGEGDE